jgi:hypothetical protein
MSPREEIEKWKTEFVSLTTEEERAAFDVKFRNHVRSKSESDRKVFADAFHDSALEAVQHAKKFCNEVTVRMKLEDILHVISMTYIARVYFNKSKSWFSQKLNGNIKSGKVTSFTEDELKILSSALIDISEKIKGTARLIA